MIQSEKERLIVDEIYKMIPVIAGQRIGNAKQVSGAFYTPSNQYRDLEGSKYYHKGPYRFIHFTTLAATQSIISERIVRLYNLHNLNDPREFSFAGNQIASTPEVKKEARDNLYLISMCNSSLLSRKDSSHVEFNMWRLYGDNGNGIAIEFDFEHKEFSPMEWKDYFIGKLHYGDPSRKEIKKLGGLIKKLENIKPKVIVDLGQIICFRKSKLYELEEEVRLLFDARNDKGIGVTKFTDANGIDVSPKIKPDISKSASKKADVKYLELPIYHANHTPVWAPSLIPVPKITRITLGYQYADSKSVKAQLIDLCENSLGYIPKIIDSRLTKFYHDI
jgi:hypothetical protein